MRELRKCEYKGGTYKFHRWFDEGGFDRYGCDGTMDGSIDVGAILEDENGQVHKVFDIKEIRFIDLVLGGGDRGS